MRLPSPLASMTASPWRAVTTVLTAVAVLFALAVLAAFAVPKAMGLQAQVVLSGSMEPAIQTGGIAFLQPTNNLSSIKIGDVITFKRPEGTGELVTHRVTQVNRTADGKYEFKTKGDASQVEDFWTVPGANVSGIVKFDLPYLGYLVELARSREGFLLLIVVPAAIIGLGELKSMFDQRRRRKTESS